MKMNPRIDWLLRLTMTCLGLVLGSAFSPLDASPVVLQDVPAYNWYHGCGPTAAGSIMGYWDLHGYPNLFGASGWAEVSLTLNVRDEISSPEHNARYDSSPDNTAVPQSWNSIADWFRTSVDPLQYGWSYISYAPEAFTGYAAYRGYAFSAHNEAFGYQFAWSDLTAEIDAGRPLMFLVDTDGDASTDHFVPVLGYDHRGTDSYWYGFYSTWDENEAIAWKQFRPMGNGWDWGVGYATLVYPEALLVPEPPLAWCLFAGFLLVSIAKRRPFRRLSSLLPRKI